jgi:uncharacterized protein
LILVVIDTNVIVSGLLNEHGNPGKILDLLVGNQLKIAYDDRILGEYEEVLARPELKISQPKARTAISFIELSGLYVDADASPHEDLLDLKDLPFVEVFITSNAHALVTGNFRHFKPLYEKGLSILSPTQFMEKFFPNL